MCIERGRERKEEEEDDDAYFASDEPGTDWRIGVDGSGCECKDAEIKAETECRGPGPEAVDFVLSSMTNQRRNTVQEARARGC